MFRKTIAVLLVFSIVLSSCGKKDKDESNDFVRTAPIPVDSQFSDVVVACDEIFPVSSSTSKVSNFTNVDMWQAYFKDKNKCLVSYPHYPNFLSTSSNFEESIRSFKAPPFFKSPSSCTDSQVKCLESLRFDSDSSAAEDCSDEQIVCISSLLDGSVSPLTCSPNQRACFVLDNSEFLKNNVVSSLNCSSSEKTFLNVINSKELRRSVIPKWKYSLSWGLWQPCPDFKKHVNCYEPLLRNNFANPSSCTGSQMTCFKSIMKNPKSMIWTKLVKKHAEAKHKTLVKWIGDLRAPASCILGLSLAIGNFLLYSKEEQVQGFILSAIATVSMWGGLTLWRYFLD